MTLDLICTHTHIYSSVFVWTIQWTWFCYLLFFLFIQKLKGKFVHAKWKRVIRKVQSDLLLLKMILGQANFHWLADFFFFFKSPTWAPNQPFIYPSLSLDRSPKAFSPTLLSFIHTKTPPSLSHPYRPPLHPIHRGTS